MKSILGVLFSSLLLMACGEHLDKEQVESLPLRSDAKSQALVDNDNLLPLPKVEREGAKSNSKSGAFKEFLNECVRYADEYISSSPSRVAYEVKPGAVALIKHRSIGGISPLVLYSYRGVCAGNYAESSED